MKISYSKCLEILKTLPVGYYLGMPLAVDLSPICSETFVNMETFKITVSFKMIETAIADCSIPEDEFEQLIRGLLYHEISHVILTNPNVITTRNIHVSDHTSTQKIMNTFEDERIETLLAGYYMNVNFRKNVFYLNGYTPGDAILEVSSPKAYDRFYAAVRFRIGPKNLIAKINRIIAKYSGLNKSSDISHIRKYQAIVIALYEEFVDYTRQNPQPPTPSQRGDMPEPTDQSQQQSAPNNGQSSENPAQQPAGSNGGQNPDKNPTAPQIISADQVSANAGEKESAGKGTVVLIDNSQQSADDILRDLAKAVNSLNLGSCTGHGAVGTIKDTISKFFRGATKAIFENEDLAYAKARVEKIIKAALNKRANQSAAHAGYAGRIDPRQCGNRNYKWFIKSGAGDINGRFDSIKLNMFVDNSGSFDCSKGKLNAVLLALQEVESKFKAFTFDVVRIDTSFQLMPKDQRYVLCDGGSNIRETMIPLYNKLQDPKARTVNIAVFDGFMTPPYNRETGVYDPRPWRVFNHPNCIVISDHNNEENILSQCSLGKYVFVRNRYADKFIDNVLNALERLLA